MELAAANGAAAIKLQTFTPETLTLDCSNSEFYIDEPGSLWDGKRLWELYEEASTPWEWHEPLFELARSHGLQCISSAFDDTSVDFLVSLGVDAIKISSFELIHTPLLHKASATGLPIILSTGMATAEEIKRAVTILETNLRNNFALLYCTSAYPSVEKDANILTMRDLQDTFGCQVGLSDHTLRPFTAYTAVALGASLIEKHFTFSRDEGGLDAAFSMEPSDLKELVNGVKKIWQSLGEVKFGTVEAEIASFKERPSIYCIKDIKKGEKFSEENIKVVRPGKGLHPDFFFKILGKEATVNIKVNTPVSEDMFNAQAPH